jgi:dTDP-4-amino-4,6-dideoxygalactose transaminase
VIPYVDLKAQYRSLKGEIDAAIGSVFADAQFVLGPAVESFERQFASYCGVAVAEQLAADVWSLPMFPELTSHQVETVAAVFRAGVAAAV